MARTNTCNVPKWDDFNLGSPEGCREAYKVIRWWAGHGDQCISRADFDRRVKAGLAKMEILDPEPRDYVRAALAIGWKCPRCGGTGQYVTMVLNGKPSGPGGICYRCEGKGYQKAKDNHRNYWYDVKGRSYYV